MQDIDVSPTSEEIYRIKCWTDLNCPFWPDYVYRLDRPTVRTTKRRRIRLLSITIRYRVHHGSQQQNPDALDARRVAYSCLIDSLDASPGAASNCLIIEATLLL